MLERFWAAWESQKRIDSQRYQARSLPDLQPPVRAPICGLGRLGFLKSFFAVLTQKQMVSGCRGPSTTISFCENLRMGMSPTPVFVDPR